MGGQDPCGPWTHYAQYGTANPHSPLTDFERRAGVACPGPRYAPPEVLRLVRDAVLDHLDSVGDWTFPMVEQSPVSLGTLRRPYGREVPETHVLTAPHGFVVCNDWTAGDYGTVDSTRADCLGCLALVAEAREFLMEVFLDFRLEDWPDTSEEATA